jgi:hypothetical protein
VVLAHNRAALALYRLCGFSIVNEDAGVVFMTCLGNSAPTRMLKNLHRIGRDE